VSGPLSREQARALLTRADELVGAGDYAQAARYYRRVVGQPSADITAAALLGLGEALYRLDDEDAAVAAWRSVLELPETPATYLAWRNVAAALVRSGDLRGALDAYRQAERRAPREDRPEIASRLGWLTKELGDKGASRRYFARARGDSGLVSAATAVVLVTVAVSFACFTPFGEANILPLLMLDKGAVANGEWWRLLTVTLVHANLLHLAFNMYALWLVGPIVERFYGSIGFLAMYLLTAAAGSVASFLWTPTQSVGASGAIFGLVGVLIAAQRAHDPLVDRRTRALISQLVPLVIINLVFNLFAGFIDIAAHVGGLAAGLWLGWILAPGRVTTLRSGFRRPGQGPAASPTDALRLLGVVALVVVLAAGVVIGTPARRGLRAGLESVADRVDLVVPGYRAG
ncbi:MAG TPA: rhomboid family intramembrane serine protease, partial [Candidatus Dormibacteraeota bacterium]|nr:rhomboid family intramembrane serine protease [Candidatus Dormibacteraeota bacterium]